MATIAELQTKLTVDNAQFKRGIEESRKTTQSFANSSVMSAAKIAAGFAAIAVVLRGLAKALSETTDKFSRLSDNATRIGVGVEALQKLHYVATQSGISVETMDKALGKMQKTLGQATSGSSSAILAFTQLGLSVDELSKMDADKQYLAISDAIKNVGSVAQQQAGSWAIFGRAGGEQLSALKDDVRGLLNEADRLGVALSGDQVRAIKQYGDQVEKLDTLWEVFKAQLVSVVAGPLAQMIQDFGANIEAMGGMGAAAEKFGSIIIPILKDIATLTKIAVLPFEGLESSIQAAGLASAKLAEIRAKSKLSDATDLKEIDPEGFKKATQEYFNATSYLKAMKKEIQGIKDASKDANKERLKPLEDLSGGGTGLNTVMDELGAQKAITDQLKLQESAVERAIKIEQRKFDNQKDITSEMKRQVDLSHDLYTEARAAITFQKEMKKDLDNISSSIRQDQEEVRQGLRNAQGGQFHEGDRDTTLDSFAPSRDKQGRVAITGEDSQRTVALKEEFNAKIEDRLEQLKHTDLLKSIDTIQFQQATAEKTLLEKLEQRLVEIRDAVGGAGGAVGGSQTEALKNDQQNPQKELPPQKVEVNISASEDFVTKIVTSNENVAVIGREAARQIQSAAAAEQ